jgi:hypothetical protein
MTSVGDSWRAVEAAGVQVQYRPVTAAEVSAAEAALGCVLPASYVELVTSVGAPSLLPLGESDLSTAWNLPFAVLTPAEIVELTTDWRTSDVVSDPEMFEEPESSERVAAQLAQAVFFQLQDDPNNAFVFLLGSGDEPRVADFAHDYLEELDWDADPTPDGPVWDSFSALSEHLVTLITELAEGEYRSFRLTEAE